MHPHPVIWDLSHMDPQQLPGEPRSGTSCGLGQAAPSAQGRRAERLDIKLMNPAALSIPASTISPRKMERAFVWHTLIARSCDSSCGTM